MEAQFAFLCRRVTPESGAAGDRLTIEGFPIRTVPATGTNSVIPEMTLVVGITYSIDEAGLKDVELRLFGPDGPVGATGTKFQFIAPAPGDRGMVSFILDTPDIPTDDFGGHEFGLHVGNELVANAPFTVVAED